MNRIFTTLLSTIQSKVMSLWTKIRLWTSRSYWENKGITSLRQFFNRLLITTDHLCLVSLCKLVTDCRI